nr:MAG: viral structural protein VP12 [Seadornavirus sp.]
MAIHVNQGNCCPDKFVCLHKIVLLVILLIAATVTAVDQVFQKLPYDEQTRYVVTTVVDAINGIIISCMAIFGLNNLARFSYSEVPTNDRKVDGPSHPSTNEDKIQTVTEVDPKPAKRKSLLPFKVNNSQASDNRPVEMEEMSTKRIYPVLETPTAPTDHTNLLIDKRSGETLVLTDEMVDRIYKTSINPATIAKIPETI